MKNTQPIRFTCLLPLLLAAAPALAQEEAAAPPEPAAEEQLVLPDSPAAALEMQADLDDVLGGLDVARQEELLGVWLELTRRKAGELEQALAAPAGTPEHEAAVALRSDLDALISGANAIAEALAGAGGDVERVRAEIAALRPDEAETLEASTVPPNRAKALELPIEVLRAQLRPLTRDQVAAQLGQWLEFLQRTCLEVRNVEVSALQTDDPEMVETFNARAVALRGERSGLIKRVQAVITALERKAGDVEEAQAYLDSVVVNPPITGWRAAWVTARTWLLDKEGGVAMGTAVVKAVAIFIAFWFLAKALGRVARRATRSLPRASELLREFLTDSVRRLTILIGALIALSTLGVNMTPLVAAIGAAGLVIGLALQGTLGNLASGLMIMVYRPFDMGDVVQMAGVSGKVNGMTLMTTTIRTFDNQTIHVPNNKIWGDVITNVTANPTRRVDLSFGISYDDDVSQAKAILERLVKAHPMTLDDPAPTIRLHQLGDSSVNLIVRPWAKTSDYWDVYWDLTEQVKHTFDAEGISIPFPQRDVHLIPAPAAELPRETASTERESLARGSGARS